MEITRSKVAALMIATVYFAVFLYLGDREQTFNMLIGLVVALALIGFPDELGGLSGFGAHGHVVDKETPAGCLTIVGWIMLLGTMIGFIYWR